MSRNTVDFDDLLASLDDLSSVPPPPPEEPAPTEEYVEESAPPPSYDEPVAQEEEVVFTPPPPPPQKSAPVVHKPVQVHHSPAPSSSHHSPAPVSGDMKSYERKGTVGHGGRAGNCHKCGNKIEADYIVAQGKNYHLNHFSCHSCGTQLSGAFYEHSGQPHCQNCAGNMLPCTRCHRGITGQYIIQDGKPYHKDCSEHWVCAKCGRDVEDTVTTALGKHWHKNCFSCNQCGVQLGNSFVNKNNNPTCNNCANKGKPGCSVCSRELSGDYVTFDNKSFHKDCFKCAHCQRRLELSGFYQVNGKTVCEGCQRR